MAAGLAGLQKDVESLELSSLFNGEYDSYNATLSIHPGAGGTEAQDWGRDAAPHVHPLGGKPRLRGGDARLPPGEEAGVKSVTLSSRGTTPMGTSRRKKGVHRLVRISPFDASGRRHTSFASVDVLPEVEQDVDVELNPNDLRIDTYRASGAGGQHVNKTIRPCGSPTSRQGSSSSASRSDRSTRTARRR